MDLIYSAVNDKRLTMSLFWWDFTFGSGLLYSAVNDKRLTMSLLIVFLGSYGLYVYFTTGQKRNWIRFVALFFASLAYTALCLAVTFRIDEMHILQGDIPGIVFIFVVLMPIMILGFAYTQYRKPNGGKLSETETPDP